MADKPGSEFKPTGRTLQESVEAYLTVLNDNLIPGSPETMRKVMYDYFPRAEVDAEIKRQSEGNS